MGRRRGGGGDLLLFFYEEIGAAGVVNVFEHYFAGLERCFAETEFEELEDANLRGED